MRVYFEPQLVGKGANIICLPIFYWVVRFSAHGQVDEAGFLVVNRREPDDLVQLLKCPCTFQAHLLPSHGPSYFCPAAAFLTGPVREI